MTHQTNTPAAISDQDRAALRAEGAATERARIGSILRCEEANGREAQATMIALETDMTAEQAAKVLSASGKTTVQAAAPTISERAGNVPTFEATTQPPQDAVAKARSGWSKAAASANAAIGVK